MVLVVLVFSFLVLLFNNSFVVWTIIEVFLFFVLMLLVTEQKSMNYYSVIYYMIIQAVSGLLLLLAVVMDLVMNSNIYTFSAPGNNLCFWLILLSMFIKLSMFPFYIQIVKVFSLLNIEQCFILMIYPKVIPYLVLWNLFSGFQGYGGYLMLIVFMFLLVSFQGVVASDLRELLSWSSVNQLGWIIVYFTVNLLMSLIFLLLYLGVMNMMSNVLSKSMMSFFLMVSSMYNSTYSLMLFSFVLLFGSFSPGIFFLFKLSGMYSLMYNYSLMMLVLVFISTVSSYFFYIRMMQSVLNVFSVFSDIIYVNKKTQLNLLLSLLLLVVMGFLSFLFW